MKRTSYILLALIGVSFAAIFAFILFIRAHALSPNERIFAIKGEPTSKIIDKPFHHIKIEADSVFYFWSNDSIEIMPTVLPEPTIECCADWFKYLTPEVENDTLIIHIKIENDINDDNIGTMYRYIQSERPIRINLTEQVQSVSNNMLMDIKLIDMKMPMMHVSSDIEGIIIENCQFDSISTVTKNILVKNSNIGVLTSIDSKELKDIDIDDNSHIESLYLSTWDNFTDLDTKNIGEVIWNPSNSSSTLKIRVRKGERIKIEH